jgi:chemotaxis protein methyltransferase WspC
MSVPAIKRRVRTATGLDLPDATIAKAMRQRMRERGIDTTAEYAAIALQLQDELDALVELVVVPETWFFRDGDAFTAAVQAVAEYAERRTGPVRILSLPCASGEEAYSMAMALHDAGIAPERFRITGMDISSKAIEQARRASYRANSFRTPDFSFRDRHFDTHAGGYKLHPELRTLVEFRQGNLFDPAAASEVYDILFCRNLLIYFDEASQQAAIRRLKAMLATDGILFVGYAEAATLLRDDELELAPYPKAFALRRRVPTQTSAMNAVLSFSPRIAHAPRRRTPASAPPANMPKPAAPPAQEPATLEHARQLANRGQVDASLAAFRDILARRPDCVEACFMLGLLSEWRHEPQAAETYLRRAVYLDPNHYEALCHLALLAEGRGSESVARALRQRAERVFRRRASTTHRDDQ